MLPVSASDTPSRGYHLVTFLIPEGRLERAALVVLATFSPRRAVGSELPGGRLQLRASWAGVRVATCCEGSQQKGTAAARFRVADYTFSIHFTVLQSEPGRVSPSSGSRTRQDSLRW